MTWAGVGRGRRGGWGGCWETLFEESRAWMPLGVVVLNMAPRMGRAKMLATHPCKGSCCRPLAEAAGKRSPGPLSLCLTLFSSKRGKPEGKLP